MELLNSLDGAALAVAGALLGLIVGSFLNVVIVRFPARLMHDWRCQCRELLGIDTDPSDQRPAGLVATRSQCPRCQAAIAWYDNLPVVSWLLLKARCRSCGQPISLRYPLVELVTALATMLVVLHFGPTPAGLAALFLTWALIALPLLWLGLIINLNWALFATLNDAVVGAVAGYGLLWSVFHLFRLLTGKEGMGHGDFKLLAALGAWLGWQTLPLIILLASAVGALVGIVLIALARHGRDVPIAFGPYLAAAGWIALLWGDRIIDYWLYF